MTASSTCATLREIRNELPWYLVIESFEEIGVVADSATRTTLHFQIFEILFFNIENMKKKLLKPIDFG